MKLGICIPYRDRKHHLERLIPHLTDHLKKQGIECKFYVGHQVDDNLFNRGMMKNIAAEFAFKDGCDYIAFHDVDMIPHEECDYSYPDKTPIHIATNLSKYHYGLGYDQYFGGVVLFNKEHLEKTNGYSNEYWDWGQEDDDLFWRCYYEGYTTGKILKKYDNRFVAEFNGSDSYLSIPTNREISSCLHHDHTISILFNANQQPEKVPIWLVGDTNKKFIEYPILRKDGSFTWGISFNNSRAVTMMLFDKSNRPYYNWAKRFENLWTWVTLSVSKETGEAYFYMNNELVCQMNGVKDKRPFPIDSNLKSHDSIRPFIVGFCNHMNTYYKGKIAEIKIYNKFFDDIDECFENRNDLVLDYDFNDYESLDFENINTIFKEENVEVIENILPFRREGRFYCLPHTDEGFVNGKWAKGETTAKNEKRFVTEMQQGKINYKEDGMNSLKYELVNTEMFSDNCIMINVKTNGQTY
jgi:hypothetical protein